MSDLAGDDMNDHREWNPFGHDGLWLEDGQWERNLQVLRDRDEGLSALRGLRNLFDPAWSRAQNDAVNAWLRACSADTPLDRVRREELAKILHPVARQQMTIGGRYALLEMATMLATLGYPSRLRKRILKNHDKYDGTCAELRGGLLLRAAGANLQSEPVAEGPGPDWLARWSGGSLAVEVKAPRESKQSSARQAVLTEFFFALQRYLHEDRPVVDTGVWLTLHPSKAILEAKTVLGSPDLDAVRGIAAEAAQAASRNMPIPTTAGRFSAGRAGEFSVAPGLAGDPRVQLVMAGAGDEPQHDAKRLFELIEEAAVQLRAVEGVPGLVIIDADGDFTVLNRLSGICDSLRSESWTSELAGVAVVTRSGSGDDDLGEVRIDTIVRIVPGPRAAVLERTLVPGLRLCDREHFHADPLIAPAKRCPLVW